MIKYLMWGVGGLAAFFGIRLLASGGGNEADAAQTAAAQPQLPMFVSGGFGGGYSSGGFGGGSGVMPALPASEFPALPASSFNFPEIPGTNENDVAIADYQYRAQRDALKHEDNLAKLTFDILKFGVENPVTNINQIGGVGSGQPIYDGPQRVSNYAQPVYGPETPKGLDDRSDVIDYTGPALNAVYNNQKAISASEVKRLFQTNSTSAAEYKLYDRAKQTGASNQQIADLLNRSGIAPGRVFSSIDVSNWKYERGL